MEVEGEKSILVRASVRGSVGNAEEAWFLFKPTGDGSMRAKEVFRNAPKDQLLGEFSLWHSPCVQFGSSLYVLGGADDITDVSCRVRRIDTKNPQDGWKSCGPLPYPTGIGEFSAAGNLVYMFPEDRYITMPGGFIYDLAAEKGHKAKVPNPPGFRIDDPWNFRYCAAYETSDGNRGVLARVVNSDRLENYELNSICWKEFDKIELPPPLSPLIPEHAVLNGILYISCCDWSVHDPVTTVLHAYDIQTGRALLGNGKGIVLPHFTKLLDAECVCDEMFLVAVADFKLCYVWKEGYDSVIVANVVVSPDRLRARVSEHEFFLNVGKIQNVIPLSLFLSCEITQTGIERLWALNLGIK